METPEELAEIAGSAARAFPDDIDKAADVAANEAADLVGDLPTELAEFCFRFTMRSLVWRSRCEDNAALKRVLAGAAVAARPKVVVANSPGVCASYRSVYDQLIAGRRVGSLLGEQLMPLADAERANAAGRIANAELLEQLHRMGVRAGQTVEDAISRKKLAALWKKFKGRDDDRPAMAGH